MSNEKIDLFKQHALLFRNEVKINNDFKPNNSLYTVLRTSNPNAEVVKMLLERGATVINERILNSLDTALKSQANVKVIELLFKYGATIDKYSLQVALENKADVKVIRLLLEKAASGYYHGDGLKIALLRKVSFEIIKFFVVEQGIKPTKEDFQAAFETSDTKTILFLILHAEINVYKRFGNKNGNLIEKFIFSFTHCENQEEIKQFIKQPELELIKQNIEEKQVSTNWFSHWFLIRNAIKNNNAIKNSKASLTMFAKHLVPPKPIWQNLGFLIFQEIYLIEPEWVINEAMNKFKMFELLNELNENKNYSIFNVR